MFHSFRNLTLNLLETLCRKANSKQSFPAPTKYQKLKGGWGEHYSALYADDTRVKIRCINVSILSGTFLLLKFPS